MNRYLFPASGAFLLTVALGTLAARGTAGPPSSRASPEEAGSGARILAAAEDLFQSLGEKEQQKALFDRDCHDRLSWHFIPQDRIGVPLKELTPEKRAKVIGLLQASLSREGARKAEAVMAHEEILRELEGPARKFPRDPLLYYLCFFGKPTAEERWGFRVEGHHLSLNFTLKGMRVLSATPLFYGANPAIVREGPKKGLRLLAGVEDLARELVAGLGDEVRSACLGDGGRVPKEVPAGREKVAGPFPIGVAAGSLKEEERRKLARLIEEYTRNLPPDLAEGIGGETMKEVHIAWQGSLKPYEPHSYLIHGPGFMINYANTQNDAAHIHSCLRKLDGEFGLKAKDNE